MQGYSGRLCDLHENPPGGNWRWLSTDAEGMTARAAHTAVYIDEEDSLYVFGGYDLNNVISNLQVSISPIYVGLSYSISWFLNPRNGDNSIIEGNDYPWHLPFFYICLNSVDFVFYAFFLNGKCD